MSYTKKEYFFLILILGTLTALGPFSIDMYLPGFPAIAADLHTNVARVSLTLSSYFVGISAGQLLYGPLLDRFGRKKPLYMGLALYILASLGCIASHRIDQLMIARFLQAIGSCAAAVASMALVRDLFPVKDSAKVFSLLLLVVGASPMIAPTVGGYVTAVFGWHSVFIILLSMGALILAASIFSLPPGLPPNTSLSLKPVPILVNFWQVLRTPQFYTYAFTGAVAFSGLFAYVSGSPLLFMDIFHVSGKQYGWIFAFLSIGFIGSSQVNSLLLKTYQSGQIIRIALVAQSVIALVFLLGTVNGWLGLGGTIALLFLLLSCIGFTYPNASALSLAPFAQNAGTAASLMGALQMGIGSLASVGVSLFNVHSAVPMVAIMTASALLALLILLIGRRKISEQVTTQHAPDAGILH